MPSTEPRCEETQPVPTACYHAPGLALRQESVGSVFRSLVSSSGRPRRGVRVFVALSLLFHVGLIGLLSLKRRAVSAPPEIRVPVALVEPSALRSADRRPPAAGPPPPRKSTIVEHRYTPKPLLAPKEVVPVVQAQPPVEELEETGAEQGKEGGVGDGGGSSPGGTGTGALSVAPPPQPRPPPARPVPVFESEINTRRRRIAGHDPAYPLRAERNGIEGVVVVKLVIGPDGNVADVIVTQTHPVFEPAVRDAIAGWRFAPLVVNGKPVSVVTVFRFTFKLT